MDKFPTAGDNVISEPMNRTSDPSTPSFHERASIWLALRHLRHYHPLQDDMSPDNSWWEIARRHLDLHRFGQGSLTRHCYWTPALAHPEPMSFLVFAIGMLIPISIFFGIPPVPWVVGPIGWWITGSIVEGLIWAGVGCGLAVVLLLIHSSVRSVRMMFIPPSQRTLFRWEKYRSAFAEDVDDAFDPEPFGPYTYLWPAPLRWDAMEEWGVYVSGFGYKCHPVSDGRHAAVEFHDGVTDHQPRHGRDDTT